MHNRVFEIREGRPFSEEELKYGTIDENEFLNADGCYADYIVPSEYGRENDLKFLDEIPFGVLTRDGDKLTFSQTNYEAYVADYVAHIKEQAASLTPGNFYPAKASELQRWLKFQPDYMDAWVCCKTEEKGWYQFMPINEFLMYVGEYLTNKDESPVLFIGKAWDFHW